MTNSVFCSLLPQACAFSTFWRRVGKVWSLTPHIDYLFGIFEKRRDVPLSPQERELVHNALNFSALTADDVSVPRSAIITLPVKASYAQVLQAFAETAHSRLPVIGQSLDEIKGFVLLKDVIAKVHELRGREKDFSLIDLVRPAPFIPETMPLPRVLQMMRHAHAGVVLVVDEFGSTSGMVTLRDVLEELVGDIVNERTDNDESSMVALGNGRFYVRASLTLEDFDAAMGTRLSSDYGDKVATLGGAVLHAARRVPAQGERVRLSSKMEVVVAAANNRRVLAVEVTMA